MKASTINFAYLSLLLYVFACFLGSTAITISFIAANVFLFVDIVKRLIEKKKITFELTGHLLYFAWALIALVFSQLIVQSIHGEDLSLAYWLLAFSKNLFIYFFMVYIVQNFEFKQGFQLSDLKKFFILVIASASLISSIYILLQFFGIAALNHKGHFGIISQPFTSSGLLLAGIFSSLYFHRHNFLKKGVLLALVLIQILALLFLSQVSAWFGLLFGFLLINFKHRIISFKLLGLLFTIGLVTLFAATQYIPRMKRKMNWFTSIEKLTTNKSVQCRTGLWQANLKDFKSVWLFGRKDLVDYSCTIKKKLAVLPHAHSIYLQPLFTGGVFKLSIWLSFYLGLFFFLIRTYSENQVFLGYFIALSVEGLFEYWWGDSEVKNIFLALMFCVLLTNNHLQNKAVSKEP